MSQALTVYCKGLVKCLMQDRKHCDCLIWHSPLKDRYLVLYDHYKKNITTIQTPHKKNYFTFGCFADVGFTIPICACLPFPIWCSNCSMGLRIRFTFLPVSVVHDCSVQPQPLLWRHKDSGFACAVSSNMRCFLKDFFLKLKIIKRYKMI